MKSHPSCYASQNSAFCCHILNIWSRSLATWHSICCGFLSYFLGIPCNRTISKFRSFWSMVYGWFAEDWKKRSWLNCHNPFMLFIIVGPEGSSWPLMRSQKISFQERPALSEIPLTLLEVIQSSSFIRNCPWAVPMENNKTDPLLTREDKRCLG